MSHIRKRNGKYQAVFVRSGKRKSLGCYRTKREAEAVLRKAEIEGVWGVDIRFGEFSELWLDRHAALKKPSTQADYRAVVNCHLLPHFGRMYLSEITAGHVQGFVTERLKKRAPRTVNKCIMILKLMFRHAEVWGYAHDNPVKHVERATVPHKEMDYLKPDEVRRFLSVVNEHWPEHYPLFATAILTGLREGELAGLKWGDLDGNTIYIRRTYNPRHGFGSPKTKRGKRAVVVSPQLAAILEPGDADKFVFSDEPLNISNVVRNIMRPALQVAEIRRVRFHDLRHTYAALMISMGVNIKFVSEQMGHSSISTTLDLYGHLLPSVGVEAQSKLDSLLFSENVLPYTAERP